MYNQLLENFNYCIYAYFVGKGVRVLNFSTVFFNFFTRGTGFHSGINSLLFQPLNVNTIPTYGTFKDA